MWGIDVSRHQGTIDWRSVKNYGIQFVLIKVMKENSHIKDERFDYNYDQSGLFGLERGAYLYMIATNEAEAHIEVADFLNIIKGKQFERGVWLDVEDSKIRPLGKDKLTELVKIEAAVLEAHGYQTGIYSNLDWYQNALKGEVLGKSFNWWMARYPENDEGSIKLVLKPSQPCVTMWQYSSKGRVDGIRTDVDMNFDVYDLRLSVEEVAKQVLTDKWGSGEVRKHRLIAAGYNYEKVQQAVNELVHLEKYYPKYTGISLRIDQVLQAIGVDPQYIGNKYNRQPIAVANDINDYKGSLAQNLKLVSLAKEGQLRRPQ